MAWDNEIHTAYHDLKSPFDLAAAFHSKLISKPRLLAQSSRSAHSRPTVSLHFVLFFLNMSISLEPPCLAYLSIFSEIQTKVA